VPIRSVLAAALLTATLPPTVGADAQDERRDVAVYMRVPGPTASERRSIDLRRVIVEPGPETVRFRVRMARLLPDAPFDQVADVLLLPPEGSGVDWAGTEIWMSTRRPRTSFANLYSTVADPVRCPRLRTYSDPATGWLWLDVPRPCLPPSEMVVEVETLATETRNASPPYSRDFLAVPDTMALDAPPDSDID
jgi:hypothetical protein